MKRRYIPVGLCAFAAALLLCAYALYAVCFFRARTPLERDAEQTALEFMKAYGLDGGGRVVDTESPFMNFTVNGGKYRTVIVRIDPPAPSDGIWNRPARRGMYVFWIDDDGVLCVCYE